MRLGKMHHRAVIEAPPDAAANSLGEPTLDWSPVCECWASFDTLSGRELYRETQVQADATHKVTIRFRQGITSDMRVVFEGRKLNIYRIDNPEEKDEQLWLYCTEQK